MVFPCPFLLGGLHLALQLLGEWTSGRPTGLHLVGSKRTLCLDISSLCRDVLGGCRARQIHHPMLLHYQWHGCVGAGPYVSICCAKLRSGRNKCLADLILQFVRVNRSNSPNSSKILPAKQHGVERSWVCGTRCSPVVSVTVNEVSWWQTQSEHIIHDSSMTSLVLLLVT